MGSGGSPAAHFCENGGVPVAGKKTEYRRIRMDSGHHRRIRLTAAVLGLLAFVPMALRLYDLMVVNYDYYAREALRNQTRTTYVTAMRGAIYDRNMNTLAASVGVENVYLDPHELKQSKADLSAIAAFLGELLDVDPESIEKKGKDLSKRYQMVAARVDRETGAKIRSYIQENDISGIHLEPNSQRYYPMGTLASQVIGFTNASNTGSEGVEAAYDRYLTGGNDKVVTTKGNNEMDMPFSFEKFVSATPGCSVVLTLDSTVQACLEKRMEEAIARYDVQNGAFGLVMNVKTGEILAMATLGGYDPNDYQTILNPKAAAQVEELRLAYLCEPEGSEGYTAKKKAYQEAMTAARLKQWRNRVLSDGYEPGSTFKVLTMAAALDSGSIDLDTNFYCKGAEQIPGRSQLLHCWRSAGHGSEKTPQALQNSCNIAFAHIALKMGGETFYEYVRRFGILEKTGIDLAGESKGVFFDKALVTDTDKWGTASLTSGSFGQTFKLTPLQLARAISSVVNGGYLMELYIVSEVLDAKGNTVLKQEPTIVRRTISRETSDTMRGLLRSVVTEGTAKNASVAGFSIGGKTGTSEKIDVFDENGSRVTDKIVSFVGVAPMEDPSYLVLVALDTPSRSTGIYISGGVMAAPTVGSVMSDILPYLEVERNYTEEDAAGREMVLQDWTGETVSGDSQVLLYCGETPEAEDVTVPNFLGMDRMKAAQAAQDAGLNLLILGNTDISPEVTAAEQSVPPGMKVPRGTTIRVQFLNTKAAD